MSSVIQFTNPVRKAARNVILVETLITRTFAQQVRNMMSMILLKIDDMKSWASTAPDQFGSKFIMESE